jgi:hypothetical protein
VRLVVLVISLCAILVVPSSQALAAGVNVSASTTSSSVPSSSSTKTLPPLVSPPPPSFEPSVPTSGYAASMPAPNAALPAGVQSPLRPSPVTEVTSARTAQSETWLNADGSKTVRMFAEPHYYQVSGGSWQAIDTTLRPDPTSAGWYVAAANAWSTRLGPTGSGPSTVVQFADGSQLASTPVSASPSSPVVSASDPSAANYGDVWNGVDVSDRVTPVGVKETLTLKNRDAPASFDFDLSANATAQAAAAGTVSVTLKGHTAVIPAPTMTDATGDADATAASLKLSVVSDEAGREGGRVRVSIDGSWLASLPDAAFPVVIDPSVSLSPDSALSSYSVSALNGHSTNVQVGRDSSGDTWRAVMHFPYEQYLNTNPPYQVVNAFLELHDESGSTAASEPLKVYAEPYVYGLSYSSIVAQPVIATETDAGVLMSPDVSSTVRSWFGSNTTNAGFGLQGSEPGSGNTLKIYAFGDSLYTVALNMIIYQAPPSTTISQPTTGAVVSTATPQLVANAVSWSDCTPVYDFKIGTNPDGSGTVIDSGYVQASPANQWQVTSGSLLDG